MMGINFVVFKNINTTFSIIKIQNISLKYLRYKILLPHHVGNEATIAKQNSDDKANHSHALMHPFDLLPWEPQRAGLFRRTYHLHQHPYPSHEKPDGYAAKPHHILNESGKFVRKKVLMDRRICPELPGQSACDNLHVSGLENPK